MSDKARQCVDIEVDLVASAVGEAEAATSRRVQTHLERCGPCRLEFGHYQAIEGEVVAMRSHPIAGESVTRAREQLATRLDDLRSRLVTYRVFPSPFGDVLIAQSEQGIVLVEYLGRGKTSALSRLERASGLEAVEDGRELEEFGEELREYLEGQRRKLRWPLDLRLARSDFHRRVLAATSAIPYGAVMSYKGLAREIGRPKAVRAAAQALRWNPLPIVIPCHRVIGSSGALTGYAGGKTTRKQKLLAVEGVPLTPMADDFRVCRDVMYLRAPGETEYCLPSCASVDPFPIGGTLFGSRERAESAGLQPCTTCRPDLHPLRP